MANKKVIIGLCGKQRVGKDTAYKIIKELYPQLSVRRFAFADALKKACAQLFCISESNFYFAKEKPTRLRWENVNQYFLDDFGNGHHEGFITHRELLQLFGMACRYIYPDIWVDIVINQLKTEPYDIAVITDVRFPNEVQKLKEIGAILIKIKRKTGIKDIHQSEQWVDFLKDKEFDYIMGTYDYSPPMDELYQRWRALLKEIL